MWITLALAQDDILESLITLPSRISPSLHLLHVVVGLRDRVGVRVSVRPTQYPLLVLAEHSGGEVDSTLSSSPKPPLDIFLGALILGICKDDLLRGNLN